MIWGVSRGGWWFPEMAALFLAVAIVIVFLSGLSEKAINTFINGAADLVGVALIIGVARAINIVMDNGMISDTLLYYTSSIIRNMNGGIFAVVQMILFSFLRFLYHLHQG